MHICPINILFPLPVSVRTPEFSAQLVITQHIEIIGAGGKTCGFAQGRESSDVVGSDIHRPERNHDHGHTLAACHVMDDDLFGVFLWTTAAELGHTLQHASVRAFFGHYQFGFFS